MVLVVASLFLILPAPVYSPASWPTSWIQVDWDKNENGAADDWRDVEYAYYQYDSGYLYLKLQCYDLPGKHWTSGGGRYKWFIDLDGNMYYSGGNIFDAEYLLFVEDTDQNGIGELYLLSDANNDNNFGEYEPWPPANYANYKITDTNIGGWRIVSPNQIEMYVSWASIGNPASYQLFWSTDQQNPNLDQSPESDRTDETSPIAVHNVAAISQTPTPTIVKQGENVTITVVVENKGTQTETFNVTCYFDNTVIGTKLVTNSAAGQQTTLNFNWDTTGIPAGNYAIKAWADSSAIIIESNEQDNWCTSPAVVTVQHAPVHDVAAISQVPDKTSVVNGTVVNINVTVSNLGDFTENFTVATFYNTHLIGYQSVTNLANKTSANLVFSWNTTGVAPGTYYILAMADSSKVITEIDENNNNCTSFQPVTVYSPGQMGKLFVDKAKTAVVSGSDPPVVGLPTVYELTIIVTNVGGSNVSNIIVNETISSEVTFVSVGTPTQGSIISLPPPKIVWSVGTLVPGRNATLTFRVRVTPTAPSLIYLNHKEDLVASGKDTLSGNTVSDTGDTDVTVTAIVRDVAAISQVPSSIVVSQGDTVAIQVTVKNFGNVSETFNVTACYNGNPIGIMRVYNLAPGTQTTIAFAWDTTGVPPGTYSISAEADSSHEIAESNETNNICTSPATVKIVIHDIAAISQVPSPTTVVQGEIVTTAVDIKNEGTEPETFNVSCYYNNTLLSIQTVTNLQPNTTTTLNFVWNTTDVPAGTYYIYASASTVQGEKDTNDNTCRSVTTVTVTLSQYRLIMNTNFGTTNPSVGEHWYGAGSLVQINATAPSTVLGERYVWLGWTGTGTGSYSGTNNPASITMNGPINETAAWRHEYSLTVTSPYDSPTPTTGWFAAGTSITASVTSPVAGPTGTRYVCTGWTGTGSVPASGTTTSVTFTINAPSTITWNWKTQYLLTVLTDPTGLSPQPTRNPLGEAGVGGSWYDSTTSVQLTAQTVSNYDFLNWDVDTTPLSGNPITVFMNGPHTATAHYKSSTPPPGPAVGGYAAPISIAEQVPLQTSPVIFVAVLLAAIALLPVLIRRRGKDMTSPQEL